LEPIEGLSKKPAYEQAEFATYRTPDGELYVPGINVQRGIVSAACFSKGKGRGTLQKTAAACMFVSPEYLILNPQEYIVDSRAVVIKATRGRIVRHRPRLDTWSISFDLEWDGNLISEPQARRIVDDLGCRVGLLDFRPECKGAFGRFMVTSWKRCG
jgi:hypothetical protein